MNPLVRSSSERLHAEYDLTGAARLFERLGRDSDLAGEHITSPFDLYSVEVLRDRHQLRVGDVYSADVFVFGRGEPSHIDCTKFGGRPYWPVDRPWPLTDTGTPYQYLAQINFADSRDLLLPDLPGDVLLLFVRSQEDLNCPDQLHFEWLKRGVDEIKEHDPSLCAVGSEPFFGAIYRTADYPDAESLRPDIEVLAAYDLPILNGTKIGGFPHLIQSFAEDLPGAYLCQVSSIQACPDVPYPWVNRQEALSVGFGDAGIHADENEVMFGDVGSVYIFLREDGSTFGTFECY